MDRDETLVEIVGRLEKATARLETLIDGNDALGLPGMASEVRRLRTDVDSLNNRTVSMWQWILGYVVFIAGMLVISAEELHILLELQHPTAWAGGVVLLVLAGVLFLSGLGWLQWRR